MVDIFFLFGNPSETGSHFVSRRLLNSGEVNSTRVITSGLANQRAPKALFTCVVHTNIF